MIIDDKEYESIIFIDKDTREVLGMVSDDDIIEHYNYEVILVEHSDEVEE